MCVAAAPLGDDRARTCSITKPHALCDGIFRSGLADLCAEGSAQGLELVPAPAWVLRALTAEIPGVGGPRALWDFVEKQPTPFVTFKDSGEKQECGLQDLVEGLALTPRDFGASFLLHGWSRKVVVALASLQRCLQPSLLPLSPLRRATLVFAGAELEGSLPAEHKLPHSPIS